jgi:3-dehydroquinate synthase
MKIPDNITISADLAADLEAFFFQKSFSKIAVIVDANTKKHCLPMVEKALPKHVLIEIESGEEHKNLHSCEKIWQVLTSHSFDRRALVVNLGGGVIGDMGGFCAATFKRGIEFINIPTTLLAQVDASIGGKLGIDFQGFKNHIGLFQNPLHVFIWKHFFETLPKAELRSGYAEVIKHCLISDVVMYGEIVQMPLEKQDFSTLTRHSIAIKNKVVLDDPEELGVRKILNFGHTVGHAVESFFLKQPQQKLLHGEAIAVGMICEAFLSTEKLGLDAEKRDKITDHLLQIYPCRSINKSDIAKVALLAGQDKKNELGTIYCSLLRDIGDCTYNINTVVGEIEASIEYYNKVLVK